MRLYSSTYVPLTIPVQGAVVACENQSRRIYGLQYHPEVRHTERGMETLKHFLFKLAGISADWKIENILEEEMEKIRRQVSSTQAMPVLTVPISLRLVAKGLAPRRQASVGCCE